MAEVTVAGLFDTPHSLLAVVILRFLLCVFLKNLSSALFWLHSVVLIYGQKQIRKSYLGYILQQFLF